MSTTPEVITRYFAASAADDVDALVGCFTDDAWVFDEGKQHDGRAAIRAWRDGTSRAYTYTVEVRGVVETAPGEFTVDTHLEGDFPGGVVDLVHVFGLRDELISHLTI